MVFSRYMGKSKALVAIALVFMACCWTMVPDMAQAGGMAVSPDHIEIGTFYNGTEITVTGTMPDGAEAVVRVLGDYTTLHLKKKGKIGGLLWMNVADVSVGNIPMVFLVSASKEMATRLDTPGLDLGYRFLQKEMTIEPSSEDKGFIFGELVKLMEESGTYGVLEGRVSYGPVQDGRRQFTATVPIPPKMKQGEYRVEAFAVKDGTVLEREQATLALTQVGFPALISELAFEHPLVYGIGAVIIAILAGLVTGALFKGGGAH